MLALPRLQSSSILTKNSALEARITPGRLCSCSAARARRWALPSRDWGGGGGGGGGGREGGRGGGREGGREGGKGGKLTARKRGMGRGRKKPYNHTYRASFKVGGGGAKGVLT